MKVDESLPVLVAGDPERNSEKLVAAQGGILYARQIVDDTVCEFLRVQCKYFPSFKRSLFN